MACRGHFRFDVAGMKRTTFFITGTDTGVGKTVLTALLARYLRERGVNVRRPSNRFVPAAVTMPAYFTPRQVAS